MTDNITRIYPDNIVSIKQLLSNISDKEYDSIMVIGRWEYEEGGHHTELSHYEMNTQDMVFEMECAKKYLLDKLWEEM